MKTVKIITLIVTAILLLQGCTQPAATDNATIPKSTETPSAQAENQMQTQPQTQSAQLNIAASDWKKFIVKGKDAKGGFTFEYPANWTASENSVQSPDWKHLETGAQFLVMVDPDGTGFEYLSKNGGSAKTQFADVVTIMDRMLNEDETIEALIYSFERTGHKYWFKFESSRKDETSLIANYKIENRILNSIVFDEPGDQKTFDGDGFSFTYPANLIADDKGLWTEDGYKTHIDPVKSQNCSTCNIPYIEIRSEKSDKTIDQYIIRDAGYTGNSLEEVKKDLPYQVIQLGANKFYKTTVSDLYNVTTYFAKDGDVIVAFKVYFDQLDNAELQKIIASLTFDSWNI